MIQKAIWSSFQHKINAFGIRKKLFWVAWRLNTIWKNILRRFNQSRFIIYLFIPIHYFIYKLIISAIAYPLPSPYSKNQCCELPKTHSLILAEDSCYNTSFINGLHRLLGRHQVFETVLIINSNVRSNEQSIQLNMGKRVLIAIQMVFWYWKNTMIRNCKSKSNL